jgi:hypothetical protein
MTRPTLILLFWIACSASLAAEDGYLAPSEPVTSGPPVVAKGDAFDDPFGAHKLGVTESNAPSPFRAVFQLEDEPPAVSPASEFAPVCDCCCTIPPLDTYCYCDEPFCTTDEWLCHPCQGPQGNCYLGEDGQWVSNDYFGDVGGDPQIETTSAFRFGWWGVDASGSPTQIGQFQDLHSSPFWDFDMIRSDGQRTLDLILSGLDNEANFARGLYYGPELTAKVKYNRFLRHWDHDPLVGFAQTTQPAVPPPGSNDNVVVQDLNVGEDYAIRVEMLDAKFQGHLTENVKWRLNLWGQRKFGERQSNATAHCFNVLAPAPAGATGNVCHVLSQKQNIDWLTMEIQPVVEARFENTTIEYSHTTRSFGQADQLIDRQYTRFNFQLPSGSGFLGPDYQYALVPENVTQIDRVKATVALSETRDAYANLYVGDTHNEFRDTRRQFGGYDVRLIDRSVERVTSTLYVSNYDENNQIPPFFFNAPPLSPANDYDEDSIRRPVDYSRTRAGWKGNWRPTSDYTNGFMLAGGYEYYQMARDYAVYDTALGTFEQEDTKSHNFEIGPQMRWSPTRTSYVRYKASFFEDPLIGVREHNGRFNTNQPEQVHSIDLGGTWAPLDNLVATAQFSIVNSWHNSQFANFNEDSYPFFCTLFYAPTERLSFTGGYFYFSNWIDQDITLGFTVPGVPVPPLRTETTHWNYRGQNHLFNINAVYAWSQSLQFLAGYEWNHGDNNFVVPPSPAGADWSLLPFLADVTVETQRATVGADYQPYDNTNLYLRYVFYDWNDIAANLGSGTANMVLVGGEVRW